MSLMDSILRSLPRNLFRGLSVAGSAGENAGGNAGETAEEPTKETAEESAKEPAGEAVEESAKSITEPKDESSGESIPKTSNILYVAKFLLPDKDGDLKFQSEQAFQERPTVATNLKDRGLPNHMASVLEEHRELSCSKDNDTQPLRDRVDDSGLPVLRILSPSGPDRLERKEWNASSIKSCFRNGQFVYPFRDLYHIRERLREYRGEVRESHDAVYSETCQQHLDTLLEYLDDQAATILKDVPRMLGHASPKTTLRTLWYLFRPGSDVYAREDGKLNAYVVDSSRYSSTFSWNSDEGSLAPYRVYVWNLNFDGRHLTRSVKEISIPGFAGQCDIRSLPVFPVEYHDDKSFGQKLVDRGKRFVDMVKQPSLHEYTGPSKLNGIRDYNKARAVVDHASQPWTLDNVQEASEGVVFTPVSSVPGVELDEYIRIPRCACETCDEKDARKQDSGLARRMFDNYDEIDLQRTAILTDHQYMLCPSHVYGVIVKDNIWDIFEVDRLEPPRIQANLIDMLVMKTENKQMLKAICDLYRASYSQPFSSDYGRGKGEGQTILLHGLPGSGKTLTAESVAEYTARPLLRLTTASLGHGSQEVKTNLLGYFRTAKRWNAIVLLDNADDLIEATTGCSQQAGFLQALDAFEGLLIITTTRIAKFDRALMSRIHLRIGYDPLEEDSRQQIWNNHFENLSRNKETHDLEIRVSDGAKEFVRKSTDLQGLRWNGHEIRKAFETALTLACSQVGPKEDHIPVLTEEHLRQVVSMSLNFNNYMHRENEWIDWIYL
ncbi:P-loop containing nucleoside triphosphate hydrolase protein [Aspergillus karnatakaensis]|uniref:P-loop containing nucleoside triphosphate hydrolase protein n=1 Tax=Aspergillus karnatakaensis TaxID=1810916 RepID=UPI003CCE3606